MIAVAVVLLLIVVVFAIAVVVSNPDQFDLSIFGATIPVTAAGVFFTGAGAMLVLIVAAALLRRGIRRGLRRRRQVKTLQTVAGGNARGVGPGTSKTATGIPPAAGVEPSGSTAVGQKAEARPSASTEDPARVTAAGSSGSSSVAGSHQEDVGPSSVGAGSEEGTSAAERQALLEEAEELTGDSPDR